MSRKFSHLKGILFTILPFTSLYVLSTSFPWHCQNNLFLSHFPSNLLVPNFSATSCKGIQASAPVSNNTGTPSCGTKENCLLTLALMPKKLFLSFRALEHVLHCLCFYRQGNSLTEVKQLTSSRYLNQEYI